MSPARKTSASEPLAPDLLSAPVAEVALNLPLEEPLDYSIPETLDGEVRVGVRVRVPLASRKVVGFCVGRRDSSPHKKLRDVEEVLDDEALVDDELLELARWMAKYYCCSLGEALAAIVPAPVRRSRRGAKPKTEGAIRLAIEETEARARADELSPRTVRQAAILRYLVDAGEAVPIREILRRTRTTRSPIQGLIEKGWIQRVEIPVTDLVEEDEERGELEEPLPLSPEQSQSLDHVNHLIRRAEFRCALVLGVTGSGKTELYLQAIRNTLDAGRKSIVLLPEIALTPQTVRRFQRRFRRIAVLHSNLSDAQRQRSWQAIRRGEIDVVIGARSAIFAPLSPLGMVIIDEEHEPTYKQQSTPRYQARDLALVRAKEANALVLLGSATPSLESFQNARAGKFDLLRLSRRIGGRELPSVEIVDMAKEQAEQKKAVLFSQRLLQLMKKTLARDEQIMLFLNRRGFAPIVRCRRCGRIENCPNCDIAFPFHRTIGRLLCHYCGAEAIPPEDCADCGMPGPVFLGTGTQRVEDVLASLFPEVPVARMDSDSMQGLKAYEETLQAFSRGDVRILLGTQMIAKGHDFPKVTLVGILLADSGLHLPDFRAAERTFQLVAQCAGRSGRGDHPGKVILQTYTVDHYSLGAGSRQDYVEFAETELPFREALSYPPFGRLARVVVRAAKEDAAEERMGEVVRVIASLELDGVEQLGPVPIFRLRGEYRFQLLLKSKDPGVLLRALHAVRRGVKGDRAVHVVVDMDPA